MRLEEGKAGYYRFARQGWIEGSAEVFDDICGPDHPRNGRPQIRGQKSEKRYVCCTPSRCVRYPVSDRPARHGAEVVVPM